MASIKITPKGEGRVVSAEEVVDSVKNLLNYDDMHPILAQTLSNFVNAMDNSITINDTSITVKALDSGDQSKAAVKAETDNPTVPTAAAATEEPLQAKPSKRKKDKSEKTSNDKKKVKKLKKDNAE
ncbi:hypothetical protein MP638_000267 [Amoeboaphelidium occidentale]|nr:hypothetical protein MP638_000267 [Amoeboaphelidium occidentale]